MKNKCFPPLLQLCIEVVAKIAVRVTYTNLSGAVETAKDFLGIFVTTCLEVMRVVDTELCIRVHGDSKVNLQACRTMYIL